MTEQVYTMDGEAIQFRGSDDHFRADVGGVETWHPRAALTIWSDEELTAFGIVRTAIETPPPTKLPDTISRLDFRRLLTPLEAARFRLLEAAPKLTEAELEAAFTPESTTPELQLRVAVEDCIQQWNFLDQGVLELDHADTAEFLTVMGHAGMFGSDAETRIPQILARQLSL